MMNKKTLYFDMDGTIASLYAVDGWLPMLRAFDPTPYLIARPLINMSVFARLLHKAQNMGYDIGIISWLSKETTAEYDRKVTQAKLQWLKLHLPSVEWNEIKIVSYGTPKSIAVDNAANGFLFDDEQKNREEWVGTSFEPQDIFEVLRNL